MTLQLTEHKEKLILFKTLFCGCKAYGIDPKDHKSWCIFHALKDLKPQPKKDREAERR